MNLRDELLDIRGRHGSLTPEIVVEEARPEDSALHSRFEWDDSIAAERWRREQAASLIRSVRITFSSGNTEKTLRGFMAVRQDTPQAEYVPTEEVAADPFTTKLLLAEFEREWRSFKAKYEHLAEFVQIVGRDIAA